MAKEECLTVLAPRASTSEPSAAATGARFTAADAAGALALCRSRVGAWLLMTKIAGIDCWARLAAETFRWVLFAAIAEDWLVVGERLSGETMRRLAALALAEAIAPRLCRRCAGRGELCIRGRRRVVEACPACAGSGRGRAPSSARYARRLGVSRRAWEACWAERFRSLSEWLGACEASARRDLIRALRTDTAESSG